MGDELRAVGVPPERYAVGEFYGHGRECRVVEPEAVDTIGVFDLCFKYDIIIYFMDEAEARE